MITFKQIKQVMILNNYLYNWGELNSFLYKF